MSRLDEAWEKFGRAEHHFRDLARKSRKWMEKQANTPAAITKTYQAEQQRFVWTFGHMPPPPRRLSLIAGDALHNLRCALDYAAWQMVDAGTEPKPIKQRERITYPIIWSWGVSKGDTPGKRFAGMARDKLPGVNPKFLAIVERYQPYNNPKRPPSDTQIPADPLAVIARYANQDKHRQVHLTVQRPATFQCWIVEQLNCEIRLVVEFTSHPPEPETPVMHVYVRPTGNGEPDVKVRLRLDYTIAFEDGLITDLVHHGTTLQVRTILQELADAGL
ncbi:MAG: hypothetical protein QOG34_2012 [Frankiaceae bacterium]|nr:hypothetical protein [Frankiaceae bacterium]